MNKETADIIHTTISPCENERRIFNEGLTALRQGWGVEILALKTPEVPAISQESGLVIRRLSIAAWKGGPLKFLAFNWKLFWRLLQDKFRLIHVHDLWVLPGSALAAMMKRKKIVFDAHEFSIGLEIFRIRRMTRWIWSFTERLFIYRVDCLITINSHHATLFRERYSSLKDPLILMNFPHLDRDKGLADFHRREARAIFQGIFKYGRGLPQLIISMKRVKAGHLVLLGFGELEPQLRELVLKEKLNENVFFSGRTSWVRILLETEKARAGLVLFEGRTENYTYAAPNKFFEYVMSGTPVIASDIPTFREYNDRFQVAILVDPDSPEQIAKAIDRLLTDSVLWERLHRNCLQAREEWNWEAQEPALITLYQKYLTAGK